MKPSNLNKVESEEYKFPVKTPRPLEEWGVFKGEQSKKGTNILVKVTHVDDVDTFYKNVLMKEKYSDKIVWSEYELRTQKRGGTGDSTITGSKNFGEIKYSAIYELLKSKHFPIRPGKDRFIDIGSGLGNIVLYVAYAIGCSVTGIEIIPLRHFEAIARREVFERATSRMFMNELTPKKYEIVHYSDISFILGDAMKYTLKPFSRLFVNNLAFGKVLSEYIFYKFLIECLPSSIIVFTVDEISKRTGGLDRKFQSVVELVDLEFKESIDWFRTRNNLYVFKKKSGKKANKALKDLLPELKKKIDDTKLIPEEGLLWPPIAEMSLNRWQLIYERIKPLFPGSDTYDPGFIDMIMRTCPISDKDYVLDPEIKGWEDDRGIPKRKVGLSLDPWNDHWFFQLAQIVIQFGRLPIVFPFSIIDNMNMKEIERPKDAWGITISNYDIILDRAFIGEYKKVFVDIGKYLNNMRTFWRVIANIIETITVPFKYEENSIPDWIIEYTRIPSHLIISKLGFFTDDDNATTKINSLDVSKLYNMSTSILHSFHTSIHGYIGNRIQESVFLQFRDFINTIHNSTLIVLDNRKHQDKIERKYKIILREHLDISVEETAPNMTGLTQLMLIIVSKEDEGKLILPTTRDLISIYTQKICNRDGGNGNLLKQSSQVYILSQYNRKGLYNDNTKMTHFNHTVGLYSPVKTNINRRVRYDKQSLLWVNDYPEIFEPSLFKNDEELIEIKPSMTQPTRRSLGKEGVLVFYDGTYISKKDKSLAEIIKTPIRDDSGDTDTDKKTIQVPNDKNESFMKLESCPRFKQDNSSYQNLYEPVHYPCSIPSTRVDFRIELLETNKFIVVHGGGLPAIIKTK